MSTAAEHHDTSGQVVVVVPVKPPSRGKSRLDRMPDDLRRGLATAFALDTVSAAAAAPLVVAVLVVTDDAALAAQLAGRGHAVIPDGGTDLNDSLVQAAAEVRRRWPRARPVVLLADLPCLTPDDLSSALRLLPAQAAFVRDRHGTGTTLYAAPAHAFRPRFGVGSAAAHLDDGALEIDVRAPGLRLDVDDTSDLADALELGVGLHTAAVCADVPRADVPRAGTTRPDSTRAGHHDGDPPSEQ